MKRIAVLILASLIFTSGAKRCVSSEPPKPVSLEVHPPAVEIKAHPRKESACSQREVPIVEFVLFEDDEPIEFTEQDKRDIKALAQMANGEYFLIDTPEHKVQCAAVMWCACWRSMYGASKGFNSTIESVCSQPYQFFGYNSSAIVSEDLMLFAEDVFTRYKDYLSGRTYEEVGCVLPSEYLWFMGTGTINIFRNAYQGGEVWDWSLPNPYLNE